MNKTEFLDTVEKFIAANRIMDKSKLYLTALSGGADSVALTLALKDLGYKIEAAHCNFRLRGEESDRDENFCRSLCASLEVPLHIVHFDTVEFARLHKVSIEMAARQLRYAYFDQLCNDIGASGICVGHHLEDSVETLLINLIRGTGINGMTGISAINGNVVRPLLNVTRGDIENFLSASGVGFVTDSTNLTDDVTRNKIRLNLMPLIRSINPSADKDIAATARRLAEATKVFNRSIAEDTGNITTTNGERTVIDIRKLQECCSPEYTLFSILSKFNFSPATTEDIHEKLQTGVSSGKIFCSSSHRLLINRGDIIIAPQDNKTQHKVKIPECGNYVVNGSLKMHVSIADTADKGFAISKEKHTASFDASLVRFPIIVRQAAKGDWFVPFGMKGRKLVSDYLTDRKMNLFDKERQLVAEDASGRIIWVVNERTDNRFRISENTTSILTVRADCN